MTHDCPTCRCDQEGLRAALARTVWTCGLCGEAVHIGVHHDCKVFQALPATPSRRKETDIT